MKWWTRLLCLGVSKDSRTALSMFVSEPVTNILQKKKVIHGQQIESWHCLVENSL